jgi:hypothetical protein
VNHLYLLHSWLHFPFRPLQALFFYSGSFPFPSPFISILCRIVSLQPSVASSPFFCFSPWKLSNFSLQNPLEAPGPVGEKGLQCLWKGNKKQCLHPVMGLVTGTPLLWLLPMTGTKSATAVPASGLTFWQLWEPNCAPAKPSFPWVMPYGFHCVSQNVPGRLYMGNT